MSAPEAGYSVLRCPCGLHTCTAWVVVGLPLEAKFTRRQADAVTSLLNQMARMHRAGEVTVAVGPGSP